MFREIQNLDFQYLKEVINHPEIKVAIATTSSHKVQQLQKCLNNNVYISNSYNDDYMQYDIILVDKKFKNKIEDYELFLSTLKADFNRVFEIDDVSILMSPYFNNESKNEIIEIKSRLPFSSSCNYGDIDKVINIILNNMDNNENFNSLLIFKTHKEFYTFKNEIESRLNHKEMGYFDKNTMYAICEAGFSSKDVEKYKFDFILIPDHLHVAIMAVKKILKTDFNKENEKEILLGQKKKQELILMTYPVR